MLSYTTIQKETLVQWQLILHQFQSNSSRIERVAGRGHVLKGFTNIFLDNVCIFHEMNTGSNLDFCLEYLAVKKNMYMVFMHFSYVALGILTW